ncbi:protein translocase subunit SecD [Pseudochrobactrum sp. MP213Fo]|uniref:protein translocase subunit SecD n=1 Tax=Pseudochrobactrum sp. MP213Fo TaxID=3022250 RepID=UPI003BA37C43
MLYFPRWKSVLIWLVVLAGFIFALPNFFSAQQLSGLPNGFPKGQLITGLDLTGGTRVVLASPKTSAADLETAKTVMAERLSELGYDNARLTLQNKNQIRAEIPDVYDAQLIKDLLSLKGDITFHQAKAVTTPDPKSEGLVPQDSDVIYSFDDPPVGYIIKKAPVLSGEDIADAEVGVNSQQASVITVSLTEAGTKQLADFTAKNIGSVLAIVVDNQIVSAPTIRDRISTGNLQITGDFDLETLSNLGVVLRSGPLPAQVQVLEERSIASALGQNYTSYGLVTALSALVVVVLFMVLSYGLLGLIAAIALCVNVMLVIAVVSIFGIPVGLATIAGLVLTIGMAVDSNILLFEKMREDRRNGYSVVQAIESGFASARACVIDANLTTLIAALVLLVFGSGPLFEFAIIVTIGVVTSLFTTYTFSRLLISLWVRQSKPTTIPARFLKLVPTNTKIGFMKLSGWTAGISVIACTAALVLYFSMGLNYGIDFDGGSSVELQSLEGPADLDDIRTRLSELNIDGARVVQGKNDQVAELLIGSQDAGDDAEQTVVVKLRDEFEQDYEFLRVEVVGPTVSEHLSKMGNAALGLALIGVFAYLWLRFRWQFAVGAVLATVHDIVIMIGVFALFRIEYNVWSLAALLTVIGYSLNDTVVVYDRVRNNLRRYPQTRISVLMDAAINQTLSRTILTSLVTLLALIPLYIFGGADIGSFAVMMALGIIIATYSSVYIAGPLLWLLGIKPSDVSDDAVQQA